NWSTDQGYAVDGYRLPPLGSLARTDDGKLVAGAFSGSFAGAQLSPGVHYLVVQRSDDAVVLEQPLRPDTTVSLPPPLSWRQGQSLGAKAYADDGSVLGAVPVQVAGGRVAVDWHSQVGGRTVASVRVAAG